ncbi:MAG: BACON domain-containing protein [Alistipes sp.]|nr:BACON domain-containing protein [Alistipes sp.]
MKRSIFALLAMIVALAVACEKPVAPSEPNNNSPLTLTSEPTINVPQQGGNFTITYDLVAEEGATAWAVADNTEVVTAMNYESRGYVRIHVSENTTLTSRKATVLVSFKEHCFSVEVIQEPKTQEAATVTVEADTLIGSYDDTSLSGIGRYWVILTDGGIVNGSTVRNSEFFRLDILGPLSEDPHNARVPDGTYTLDTANNFNIYTMLNIGDTDYVLVDGNNEAWSSSFTYAELVVEGNKFTLTAEVQNDELRTTTEYYVTFKGDYELTYNEVADHVSTLDSDYEIDLTNCAGTLNCFGDYWECGFCNWQIEFVCDDGLKYGTYLVLDFLTDDIINGASGIAGTYTSTGFSAEDETKPDFKAYTFIPGFSISDDGQFLMGSLVIDYANGVGLDQAPIFDGTMTITDNGNNNYTIVIDAKDDADPAHKVTLNWTGRLF